MYLDVLGDRICIMEEDGDDEIGWEGADDEEIDVLEDKNCAGTCVVLANKEEF